MAAWTVATPVHIATTGVKTLSIAPGSPREPTYNESFIGSQHDEFLNGDTFYSLVEARVLIGSLAAPLPHRPATLQPGLPATLTRSGDCAIAGLRFRFASPPTSIAVEATVH